MDRQEQPNQIARGFAFFFYGFCLFVGIRVWIEVVSSGDKSAVIAASVITFIIICCIYSRFRRYRRLIEQHNRRMARGHIDILELWSRHRNLLEAEGININGGLTQGAIDKLPNVLFKTNGFEVVSSAAGDDNKVCKLEEGSLIVDSNERCCDTSSSSSSSSSHKYETVPLASPSGVVMHHHNDISCCSICLSDFTLDEMLLLLPKCGHSYHRLCVSEWLVLHNSCPLCKHEVVSLPDLNRDTAATATTTTAAAPVVNINNNNTRGPLVVVDNEGGLSIVRLPNNQGIGIYFIDNNNDSNIDASVSSTAAAVPESNSAVGVGVNDNSNDNSAV